MDKCSSSRACAKTYLLTLFCLNCVNFFSQSKYHTQFCHVTVAVEKHAKQIVPVKKSLFYMIKNRFSHLIFSAFTRSLLNISSEIISQDGWV